jgi:phosphatidylserine decarboxylase
MTAGIPRTHLESGETDRPARRPSARHHTAGPTMMGIRLHRREGPWGTGPGAVDLITRREHMNGPKTTRRDILRLAGAGAAALAVPALAAPEVAASPSSASLTPAPIRRPPFRVGKWLPSDQRVLDEWLASLIRRVDSRAATTSLHPSVQALKDLIESEPDVYMWFTQMFTQVPRTPEFATTPIGTPQVRSYTHALELINAVLTTAPEFNETGLVGFPINAILDWSMATDAGGSAFLDSQVNERLKAILDAWGAFLASSDSRYVLSKDPRSGWFGADARKGQRPVASPDDPSVIVNACESAPYRIARRVKRIDQFWIKGQPYSLRHIFADDPINEEFAGGTIYQAFLSALSYHRWHMPVDGTIRSVRNIDGTYYAEDLAMGFDPAGPNESQGYIAQLAARAVVTIDADDPRIGLMAFVAIGMAEVSTCEVTVEPGQHLRKGEQLGMFHFGGSTHLLVFRPQTQVSFRLHGQTPGLEASNILVNAAIARVR